MNGQESSIGKKITNREIVPELQKQKKALVIQV